MDIPTHGGDAGPRGWRKGQGRMDILTCSLTSWTLPDWGAYPTCPYRAGGWWSQ